MVHDRGQLCASRTFGNVWRHLCCPNSSLLLSPSRSLSFSLVLSIQQYADFSTKNYAVPAGCGVHACSPSTEEVKAGGG